MKKTILIIALLGLGIAGYYTYTKFISNDIRLELVAGEEISYGTPFQLEMTFANDSQNILNNTRVTIHLPSGILLADGSEDSKIIREMGDVRTGGLHREKVSVIAVPGEDRSYGIKAEVLYAPNSVSAEFKKETHLEITPKALNFELELVSPERIFRGEEFEVSATYRTEEDLENLPETKLKINLPEEFRATNQVPESDGDRTWNLLGDDEVNKDLSANVVLVNGRIDTSDSNQFNVSAELLMNILDEDYAFRKVEETVTLEPSPLSFNLVLGGQENLATPGQRLVYVLQYKNNTNSTLRDVVAHATLSGEMFDTSAIETNAIVDSSRTNITWTSQKTPELRELAPGASGELSFSIKIKDKHPIDRLNDKDFSVKVDAEIESPTVQDGVEADRTINSAEIETKVKGLTTASVEAFFRDVNADVINSGPLPPRVGVPTNFTIHWAVSNFGTDVESVEVRARLSPGVEFVEVVQNNTASTPEFDAESGEVVWNLGSLIATTGVISERPEVIFQVKATPQSGNVGNYMLLLEETRVTAYDTFTESQISSVSAPVNTSLPTDHTVNESDGQVVD